MHIREEDCEDKGETKESDKGESKQECIKKGDNGGRIDTESEGEGGSEGGMQQESTKLEKKEDKLETVSKREGSTKQYINEEVGSKSEQGQKGDGGRTNSQGYSGEGSMLVRQGIEGERGELVDVKIGWQTETEMRIQLQELDKNIEQEKRNVREDRRKAEKGKWKRITRSDKNEMEEGAEKDKENQRIVGSKRLLQLVTLDSTMQMERGERKKQKILKGGSCPISPKVG